MKFNYLVICATLFICSNLSSQETSAPKFGKGLFNLIGKDKQ